jgi:hypothetical protein
MQIALQLCQPIVKIKTDLKSSSSPIFSPVFLVDNQSLDKNSYLHLQFDLPLLLKNGVLR